MEVPKAKSYKAEGQEVISLTDLRKLDSKPAVGRAAKGHGLSHRTPKGSQIGAPRYLWKNR